MYPRIENLIAIFNFFFFLFNATDTSSHHVCVQTWVFHAQSHSLPCNMSCKPSLFLLVMGEIRNMLYLCSWMVSIQLEGTCGQISEGRPPSLVECLTGYGVKVTLLLSLSVAPDSGCAAHSYRMMMALTRKSWKLWTWIPLG